MELPEISYMNRNPRSDFHTRFFNSNFIKKEALAQVFSCEFCEISKNTFFYRTPPVAASDITDYGGRGLAND